MMGFNPNILSAETYPCHRAWCCGRSRGVHLGVYVGGGSVRVGNLHDDAHFGSHAAPRAMPLEDVGPGRYHATIGGGMQHGKTSSWLLCGVLGGQPPAPPPWTLDGRNLRQRTPPNFACELYAAAAFVYSGCSAARVARSHAW